MGTGIEWTQETWNPVTGCTKVSPGCKNCYANVMAKRLKAMGMKRYENGFQLTLQPDLVDKPRKWKKARIIFVNSMSDLFHEDVPLEYIQRVFKTMNETPRHQYQVLTKRAERAAKLASELTWTPNIWMGVSVESQKYASRIDHLRTIPAHVRFISAEPLLGPLDLTVAHPQSLVGIHWLIAGGESGNGFRPIKEEWVSALRDQCIAQGVSFFFKQWGGIRPKSGGKELQGRTWCEMPEAR